MKKTVKISYNPYKMITKMSVNDIDVCQVERYQKFKEFIDSILKFFPFKLNF